MGNEPQHYVLLPQNVDHLSIFGSTVFTGCTNMEEIHELQPVGTATQIASQYTTEVRECKGVGSMYSYSLTENFGRPAQCAIHCATATSSQGP
jgi:hypothetical protein